MHWESFLIGAATGATLAGWIVARICKAGRDAEDAIRKSQATLKSRG